MKRPAEALRVLLLFFFFLASVAQAQDDIAVKKELASQFFRNGEFEKSIELYIEVYKKRPDKEVFLNLVSSYIAAGKTDEAEKLARREYRRMPSDPVYAVEFGYILAITGEERKGEEIYRTAIRDLPPKTADILALANNFQRRNELSFAIECLQRGKKLTGEFYGFEFELGELYYQSGDLQSMINEYLDLVVKNEAYLQDVQNALNTSIYSDPAKDKTEALNTALIKRIQRDPESHVLPEMLLWHYMQQKDFRSALVQSKSMDRKNNENGHRFLILARSCRSYMEYDLAIDCYRCIIEKGPSTPHYINARMLVVETIREKITSKPYTNEDILFMEENYLITLKDIGKNQATISLQTGLAEVWAIYLGKHREAIDLLNHALKSYQLKPAEAARCKILLADIYLGENEIWEASLLYSQVEKDFKYEALGDEAKYKNAMVYFYTGDYGWSKAQLDVLKGSTSKLISNDAMRLSLLISDNTMGDSDSAALRMFGRASLAFEQQHYTPSLQILDSILTTHPVHVITDDVWYLRYRIFFKLQQYEKCAEALTKIIDTYSDGILADEAIYNLALLYESYLNDSARAQELYHRLFTTFPGSVFVPEARQHYRRIRGDEIN